MNWIRYLKICIKNKRRWENRNEAIKIMDDLPKRTLKGVFQESKYGSLFRDYVKEMEEITIKINPVFSNIYFRMKMRNGNSGMDYEIGIDDLFERLFTPMTLKSIKIMESEGYWRVLGFMKLFDAHELKYREIQELQLSPGICRYIWKVPWHYPKNQNICDWTKLFSKE